jgi:hypothetical protein
MSWTWLPGQRVSIREVAGTLGKTYTAADYGHKRVERLLNAKGQRRLGGTLGLWITAIATTLPENSSRSPTAILCILGMPKSVPSMHSMCTVCGPYEAQMDGCALW